MQELVFFIYEYYEYYFLLAASFLASIIVFRYKKNVFESVIKKSIFYVFVICWNFAVSILLIHHFATNRAGYRLEEHFTIFLIEILIAFVLGAVGAILLRYCNRIWGTLSKNKKILGRIHDNKYGIAIFIFLMVSLVINLPPKMDDWISLWYVTDYSMGMGSRFLIGSLLNILSPGYISAKTVYIFCFITYVFIICLLAVIINHLLKTLDETYRMGVITILLIFMASPGSVTALWHERNFGRLEIYGFLLSLLAIIVFERIGNIYLKYLIVTILSCLSMAVYQGNAFMYYPMVLMLIIYDGLKSTDNLRIRRCLGLANVLVTAVVFCLFQFCSYVNFDNATEMRMVLEEKTNLTILGEPILFELFESISFAFDALNRSFLENTFPREKSFLTLLILLPIFLLVLVLYMWCHEYRKQKSIRLLQAPYIYFGILPCALIPQFLLNVDWGRWMLAIAILIFSGILYLIYKKDMGMLYALGKVNSFVTNHPYVVGLVLIYVANLDKFEVDIFIAEVETLGGWFDAVGFMSLGD